MQVVVQNTIIVRSSVAMRRCVSVHRAMWDCIRRTHIASEQNVQRVAKVSRRAAVQCRATQSAGTCTHKRQNFTRIYLRFAGMLFGSQMA